MRLIFSSMWLWQINENLEKNLSPLQFFSKRAAPPTAFGHAHVCFYHNYQLKDNIRMVFDKNRDLKSNKYKLILKVILEFKYLMKFVEKLLIAFFIFLIKTSRRDIYLNYVFDFFSLRRLVIIHGIFLVEHQLYIDY